MQFPAEPTVNLQPVRDPLRLETPLIILKRLVSCTRALDFTGVPAPLKQSTASLSNPGSSYCCWQPTPVASAGGIRWEWVRRSTGANQRRPCRVPLPNGELWKLLMVRIYGGRNMKAGRQKRTTRRRTAFTLHPTEHKHLRSSHHVSYRGLRLLPMCPSLSTVGP